MTTMQWIAFSIGLLLLATRLPALIWPGPYRRTVLDILQGSGRTLIRALGGFLLLLVVTVVVLLLRTLTLLQALALRGAVRHGVRRGALRRPTRVLRAGAPNRRRPRARRLHGDDRRRTRHHGGRQPRRPRGRRLQHRLQHRAAARAEAESLP